MVIGEWLNTLAHTIIQRGSGAAAPAAPGVDTVTFFVALIDSSDESTAAGALGTTLRRTYVGHQLANRGHSYILPTSALHKWQR